MENFRILVVLSLKFDRLQDECVKVLYKEIDIPFTPYAELVIAIGHSRPDKINCSQLIWEAEYRRFRCDFEEYLSDSIEHGRARDIDQLISFLTSDKWRIWGEAEWEKLYPD